MPVTPYSHPSPWDENNRLSPAELATHLGDYAEGAANEVDAKLPAKADLVGDGKLDPAQLPDSVATEAEVGVVDEVLWSTDTRFGGAAPTDGVSDSQPAIQGKVDAVRQAGSGEVRVAPGTYQFDATLTLNTATGDDAQKPVRISGAGSLGSVLGTSRQEAGVIFTRAPTATHSVISTLGRGTEIDGISFDGRGASGADPVIDVIRGFDLRLRRGIVWGSPATALRLYSLSNPLFEDFYVSHSGKDGLVAATEGAAAAVEIGKSASYELANTVSLAGLHLERNNGCDLAIGVGASHFVEFVAVTGLHIESTVDNTDYGSSKADPTLYQGNVRDLTLVAPRILNSGAGPLIYIHRTNDIGNTPMVGTTIVGGALVGRSVSNSGSRAATADTPSYLIDAVAGDRLHIFGTYMACVMTAAVRLGSGFGRHVTILAPAPIAYQGIGGTGNTSTTTLEDHRSPSNKASTRFSRSIGGTGLEALGGTVTTLSSSGAVRNTLDDGAGNVTLAAALSLVGGLHLASRTLSTTQTLTSSDKCIYVESTSGDIDLTLPQSSSQVICIRNRGANVVHVLKPVAGSAPGIDGGNSVAIAPGGWRVVQGQSSSDGSWRTLAGASAVA